jgi:hypothetical protein
VQSAHDRPDGHAERVAALGVGEPEHVDRDERLAVRAVELVDGVEHGRAVHRLVGGRRRGGQVLADLVERGGRRTPLARAQLIAPAVAQRAQEVAQLVASRQETGA